jgi:MerR family transcriptional regulator, redox-sensitive transcriptional activator SoxR
MVQVSTVTIGQVARQAGVRASAIRYYESMGLLEAPRRVGPRRVYDSTVLDALRLVKLAKDAGFTVAEIRQLLHGFDRATPPPARWKALAERKLREVRALIDRARQMQRVLDVLLTCECVQLGDCVRALEPESAVADHRVRRRGSERTTA